MNYGRTNNGELFVNYGRCLRLKPPVHYDNGGGGVEDGVTLSALSKLKLNLHVKGIYK